MGGALCCCKASHQNPVNHRKQFTLLGLSSVVVFSPDTRNGSKKGRSYSTQSKHARTAARTTRTSTPPWGGRFHFAVVHNRFYSPRPIRYTYSSSSSRLYNMYQVLTYLQPGIPHWCTRV